MRSLPAALLLFALACRTGPPATVRPISESEWFANAEECALNSDSLSTATTLFLEDREMAPSIEAVRVLDSELHRTGHRKIAFVLAELCFLLRKDGAASNSALVYAYAYLFDPVLTPAPNPYTNQFGWARDIYNRSLARVVRMRHTAPAPLSMVVGELPLDPAEGDLHWDPAAYHDLSVVFDWAVEGLPAPPQPNGIGVPCVATKRGEFEVIERVKVSSPYSRPITVFLRIREGRGSIEVHHPDDKTTLTIGGETVPLRVDTTTPAAFAISEFDWPAGDEGLLRGAKWEHIWGLYLGYGPHEPGRIPVVFVHGLRSSPATWLKMGAYLREHPEIRSRVEFWYFWYPTGFPIGVAAKSLRNTLKAAHGAIKDPALDQMVVVGHSMGGVLTKTLGQSAGAGTFMSDASLAKLDLSDDDKAYIERVIRFERTAFVKRLVFICTPHRGSNDATGFLGRIASMFLKLPDDFKKREERIRVALGVTGELNSIRSLEPGSGVLRSLEALPIEVPYHTIVGKQDQVVAYESSHLEGAESEFVVGRAGHGAPWYPAAWAEVRRILLVHLKAVDDSAAEKAAAKKKAALSGK